MSRLAVGAYLKLLRERAGLKQEDVASHIQEQIRSETNIKQVYRWENGKSMPGADALLAFTACVNGSAVDIQKLMLDPDAAEEQGIEAARERMRLNVVQELAERVPPEQIAEVGTLLSRLATLLPDVRDLLRHLDQRDPRDPRE